MKTLLDPAIRDFIIKHENDDVADLALKKPPQKDWPYKNILDQIKSRQKAKIKIPAWLAHKDIILPPPALLEQASSSATAAYKASLLQGKTFADLTGGAGVDSAAISMKFSSGSVIDADEIAAELLAHNLGILAKNLTVHHKRAENFINEMPSVDLVLIDPQRRNEGRKGIYRLADTSPDIFSLLPTLAQKAKKILLKTSPMLDIAQTIETLKIVEEIHVLEWRSECREVLYLLNPALTDKEPCITATAIDDNGKILNALSFAPSEEKNSNAEISLPQKFLFEPGPAFQKSGAFNVIAKKYNLAKLHRDTHLYTSQNPSPDFPGRKFEIVAILPADKKHLPLKQANLTLRNFPGTAEDLRRKLGLKDGGPDTLFACTLMDGKKALIQGRKTL